MNDNLPSATQGSPSLRIFGVGDAGIRVVELLIGGGLNPASCVAIDADGPALERSSAQQRVRLESKRLRGLGSGGDPERGCLAAEEKSEELKALCQGNEVVFILAGLGGGSGTGISPVLARLAKSVGALVLAFVTLPFECEGTRRQAQALEGLEELRGNADGVICLPNQTILKLIEENTTVMDAFRFTNRLLADGVRGLWQLLAFKGLIEVPIEDLCSLLQNRHTESAFAVAEAVGPARSSQVIDKILAHPLLAESNALSSAEALLVSMTAGPNLTMSEVNRVMELLKAKCPSVQMMIGAGVDERFGENLAVTVIVARNADLNGAPCPQAEDLNAQLLDRASTARPGSRFLPPPPSLQPGQVQQLLTRQSRGRSAMRKPSTKLRQGQLPLEIVSRGRFDKSEPTIYKGEDLDVPTYIRRGVPLN